MLTAVILGILTLITSTITGVFGLGGGLLLIGLMPFLLPVPAIIPIHGVTQLASNASRAIFAFRDIQVAAIAPFLLGSLLGVFLFALLLRYISLDYLPLLIGSYILLSQWSAGFNRLIRHLESFFLVGFLQSGLAVIAGAPGPIAMTLLTKRFDNRHEVVATGAALMTITHGLKIIAFILLGVKLWSYSEIMVAMLLGAVAGSFLGTKLRYRAIDSAVFSLALKIVLSLLAIKMLLSVVI